MKEIALIITLLVCQTTSGQQISLSSNRYRGSDVLEKKQVEVNYVIAGRFFCYKLKECDILHITKEPSRCYNGEGATIPLNYEGARNIVVSGKPYNGLKDCDGNKLVDTPNYILAHELVGHAIPMLIGGSNNEGGTLTKPINGNAIDNENKVRKEVGSPLRDNKRIDNIYDDSFYESISTYYDFMDMYNSMLWR